MVFFSPTINQLVDVRYKSPTSDKAIVKSQDGKYRPCYFSTLLSVN